MHGTLGAARDVDVAGTHDADVGGASSMRLNASGPCDRHLRLLGLNSAGIEVARAGNIIICRLRLARAGLSATRPRDRELERLDVHRHHIDSARAGDGAFEPIALNLVDLDIAGAGNRRSAQLRDGDREIGMPAR